MRVSSSGNQLSTLTGGHCRVYLQSGSLDLVRVWPMLSFPNWRFLAFHLENFGVFFFFFFNLFVDDVRLEFLKVVAPVLDSSGATP